MDRILFAASLAALASMALYFSVGAVRQIAAPRLVPIPWPVAAHEDPAAASPAAGERYH